MGRIFEYFKLLKKMNIVEFLYLNYFCGKVIRTDKSKIIPYKHSVLDLGPNSKVYVKGGDIEIGCDLMKGSKTETRVRLRENSVWSSTDGCKVSYGSTIELLDGAILDSGYFTMNSNSTLVAAYKIVLGNDVMISRNVVIYDSDFHSILDEKGLCINKTREIHIGNHVWLAANVTVLKGSVIGDGTIIAANTTVHETIPPNSIVHIAATKKVNENFGTWNRKKPEASLCV